MNNAAEAANRINGAIHPHPKSGGTGTTMLGQKTTRWVLVTPAIANEYLARNNRNRKLIPAIVARYAAEMKAGNWSETHQGIAFGFDGDLYDGQHRLHGIVQAGVPQNMLVTTGLPREAIEALDRGRIRAVSDTLKIMGFELSSKQAVATANSMMYGIDNPVKHASSSHTTLMRFMDRHMDALLFVNGMSSKIPTSLRAVIARAYYHTEPAKLERMSMVYRDQIEHADARPADKTIRNLERMFLQSKGNSRNRTVLYRKSQNAVRHYLDGKVLDRIHEAYDDLFPLPQNQDEPEPPRPSEEGQDDDC